MSLLTLLRFASLFILSLGFDLRFSPNAVGAVNNVSIIVNITQNTSLGDAQWSRWTYINLKHPLYSLQLDADAKSRAVLAAPFNTWLVRFVEQDKLAGLISVKFQGVPVISGPTVLVVTITNVRVPDNCEPMDVFTVTIESDGANSTGRFQDTAFPALPFIGCQAAPVITSLAPAVVQFRENGGALPLDFANLNITDATPAALELKVTVRSNNGTVTVTNATTGVTVTSAARSLVLQGLQAYLNVALKKLVYTPDVDFGAVDTISVEADDLDYRGPGRRGLTTYSFLVNMSAVDSFPSIRLALRTPYIEVRWSTVTPCPLVMADADDPVGLTETLVVAIQATLGTFRVTLPANSTVTGASNFTFQANQTLSGTIAALNQVLATLVYRSDVRINCSSYVLGSLNVTARNNRIGQQTRNVLLPVNIVSEGVTDGCGQESVSWADFEPSAVLVGQDVSLILKGYKAWALVNGGMAVALSATEQCYLQNYTSPVAVATQNGERLQVTLRVTDVGTFTVCYWTRGVAGVSDWGLPNPMPMARKLVVYNASSVAPNALMQGFSSCQNFLNRMMAVNASTAPCGCKFMDNSTATTNVPLGNVSMPTTYPADYLCFTDTPVTVNMGCCAMNTPRVQLFPLNQNQSWGFCAYS